MKPKTKRIVIVSVIIVLLIGSIIAVRAFLNNQRAASAVYEDPEAMTRETIRR